MEPTIFEPRLKFFKFSLWVLFKNCTNSSETKFKEFEPRLNFETRLKYGWIFLKLYSLFQDLSRCSIEIVFLADLDAAQINKFRTQVLCSKTCNKIETASQRNHHLLHLLNHHLLCYIWWCKPFIFQTMIDYLILKNSQF